MSAERGDERALDPEAAELVRRLDAAARLEHEVVAEAHGPASPEEVRRVEAALPPVSKRAVGPTWGRRLAVAAGLLLAVLALWRLFAPGPDLSLQPKPGVVLGQNELGILEPQGPVASFAVLRWQSSTPGERRFEVRVFDESSGALLLRATDLKASEFRLDERDTRTWQKIRLEVDELDSGGQPVKSGRSLAWRSP